MQLDDGGVEGGIERLDWNLVHWELVELDWFTYAADLIAF